MAVRWRSTWGDTRFVFSDGHSAVATFECIYCICGDMNRTSGNRRIARKVAIVATALGLWGALVLLFAAPLALTGRVSWREAVSFGGSFWALWLLFLPAVAWLSFRFPIERRRLIRNVGLHLLACLLVVGTNRATFRAFARIFSFPATFGERRGGRLIRERWPGLHINPAPSATVPLAGRAMMGPTQCARRVFWSPRSFGRSGLLVFSGRLPGNHEFSKLAGAGTACGRIRGKVHQRQTASAADADQPAFSFQHAQLDCRVGLRQPASGRRDAGRLKRVAAPLS